MRVMAAPGRRRSRGPAIASPGRPVIACTSSGWMDNTPDESVDDTSGCRSSPGECTSGVGQGSPGRRIQSGEFRGPRWSVTWAEVGEIDIELPTTEMTIC